MPVQHFMLSVEMPDGANLDPAALRGAVQALCPDGNVRLREGFPRVLVMIPDERERDVIFSTDARVQLSLVDCRDPRSLDREVLPDRMRHGIEYGSRPDVFASDMNLAVALVTEISEIAETEQAGRGYR